MSQAHGVTYSWSDVVTGLPVSDNWSAGTNWSGVPVSAADTELSFGWSAFTTNSTAKTNTLTNDVADPFQLNILTFAGVNPSAGNGSNVALVNIDGSPLNFVSNGPSTPVINLNSNRSNGQVVTYDVQSNVTLGAGTVFTGNGTANFIFSGIVSGTSGFTKTGTSTLTLSNASNDFTGGITLEGGLAITNASAIGTNSISVTGDAQISATSGTFTNAISITDGAVLSVRNIGANNSTTEFTTAITGNVGITLVRAAGNGTTVAFSSESNTFTGDIDLPSVNGNDFISFGSMGDGGTMVFRRASWREMISYTGSADLNLTNRSITLATTFGGATGLDGGGSPINMFANNGAGVVTFAQGMVMTTTNSSGYFFFGGSNTGNNTFSGLIADPTNASTLGIGKWDVGKWILSNANNSFEGNILLGNGTLSAAAISNAGVNQALGRGSFIQLGQGSGTGTLELTGATNSSTDKQIVMGSNNNNHSGNGSILNNGNGTVTFTNTTFNSITQNSGLTTRDRTLTLGGTSTGANEIQGVIQDHVSGAAQIALTKTGAGKWVLSGTNTYTGATTVSDGILLINGDSSLATGAVSVATGATLGGIGIVGGNTTLSGFLDPGQSPGTLTFNANLTMAGTSTLLFEAGDLVDVNGTLSLVAGWTLDLNAGFSDGGSVTLFTYNTLSGSSNLNPTINIDDLGFTPSGALSLTDDGLGTITLNGVSAIPEPGTALLGGLGALLLLVRRRRA